MASNQKDRLLSFGAARTNKCPRQGKCSGATIWYSISPWVAASIWEGLVTNQIRSPFSNYSKIILFWYRDFKFKFPSCPVAFFGCYRQQEFAEDVGIIEMYLKQTFGKTLPYSGISNKYFASVWTIFLHFLHFSH